MKQLALVSIIVAAVFGALALPAGSQTPTPDTLDVLASPAVVLSVNIDKTELDYGTLALSSGNLSRTAALSPAGFLNVTNTGNSAAKLMIGATDAQPLTTGSAWALNCSPATTGTVGTNQYVLRLVKSGQALIDATAFCTGVDQELIPSLASGAATDFRLEYNMPTGTTGFGERSTTVTVTAVQP